MKKTSLFSIYLFAILAGCISTNVVSKNLTGQDLMHKYKKLQSFTYSFENDELDGAITETYVNVYEMNNQKCVIMGRTYGDSGFGGSEYLIFFKNKKMLSASLRPFTILDLEDNGIKTISPKEVSYSDPIPNDEVKPMLEESFQGYLKQINKNTLKKCRSC